MLSYTAYSEYIENRMAKLYTAVLLPEKGGKFPVIVRRTPYIDAFENYTDADYESEALGEHKNWLKRGYAVVIQHCRGRGKSSGDCVPYINEREDSRSLYDWIRKQNFYNGEIFLWGSSYPCSVHYTAAPYGDDIKGAYFGVQDTERYNICYRNGFFKKALHGNWYTTMYKAKLKPQKNYTMKTFDMLPLSDFTKTVFGESIADFDDMLKAPKRDDPFWNTRAGGSDARGATDNINFPVLFNDGFYDIYTGGMFDMWNSMSKESKARSAFIVSPYDHGDSCDAANSIVFPNGKREEAFGAEYDLDWFDYLRGVREKSPVEQGKVTYYRLFENKWAADDFSSGEEKLNLVLGKETATYTYNPFDPPSFRGGLSAAFGGAMFQDKPYSRYDIVSVYTEPFEKDVFVKGKMSARLTVSSDAEDTCFYVRVSLTKEQGDYGLRDDITSLCHQLGDYTPNSEVTLDFNFDEHAFLIKKGERLRIDIASADNDHYVRHTNNKGLFSEQTTAKIAHNTVCLSKSVLTLPTEK